MERCVAIQTPAPGHVPRRGYPLELHHAQCELNFLRLCRLLPGCAPGQERRVRLRSGAGGGDALVLRVEERSPYTAVVSLRQLRPVWRSPALSLTLRAYLDARMLEVVGCAQARRLLSLYPYPNALGFARDEKWQLDRLVGEWLGHCLAEGGAMPAPEATRRA